MVGGAPVTEPFSRALGADAWSPNAVGAAEAALQLLASPATLSR
jgi:methanogenic corrinoid protein MtbC1